MIHLIRHKWFYFTFGFWCFISALSAWALIFSPLHMNSNKISEFTAELNGTSISNQILKTPASLENSLSFLSLPWQKEGWVCVSGRINIASILLNIPDFQDDLINPILQLRLFKKNNALRLLGLWTNAQEGQTYTWIAETTQTAVQPLKFSEGSFPLKPPPGAMGIFGVKTEHTEALAWSENPGKNPVESFKKNYLSQGFSGKILSTQKGELLYILQKGGLKLFSVVPQNDKNNYVVFLVH